MCRHVSDQTEAVVVEPRSSSPLPVNEAKSYRAVAVYAFAAETNEDLSLQVTLGLSLKTFVLSCWPT